MILYPMPLPKSAYRYVGSLAKAFEYVILNIFKDYLNASDHQFVYKDELGIEMSVFSLKHFINLPNIKHTHLPVYRYILWMRAKSSTKYATNNYLLS